MNWRCFKVHFDEPLKEVVNALLVDQGADALQELEDHFLAYFDGKNVEEFHLIDLPGVKSVDEIEVVDKNWNEEWEKNFNPILVEDIVRIRAEFHDPTPPSMQEILIRPKNAFGTGHHATTYMMIKMMEDSAIRDKSILDYGCGTGILSVWAGMLGSKHVHAIDIEEPAIENTLEHIELNKLDLSKFNVECGDLSKVAETKFDVILANINRTVLLETCDSLSNHLTNDGILMMSGILKEDRIRVLNKYNEKFILLKEDHRGDWICMKFQSKN